MIGSLGAPQPLQVLKLLAHDLRWQLVTALARSDYRVQELVDRLEQPANLVSYHLKQLRDQHLVRERRSSADGRDVYYTLDLDMLRAGYISAGVALHPALCDADPTPNLQKGASLGPPARVLFLCTHNSARSQMAEGILRTLGGQRVEALSAGSAPGEVHPDAVQTLATMGIAIGEQRSKHLDAFADQAFDYIITVCDRVREVCPLFPNDPEQIHWSFPDPAAIEDAAARALAFEQTARQLITRIRHLLILLDRNHKERP